MKESNNNGHNINLYADCFLKSSQRWLGAAFDDVDVFMLVIGHVMSLLSLWSLIRVALAITRWFLIGSWTPTHVSPYNCNDSTSLLLRVNFAIFITCDCIPRAHRVSIHNGIKPMVWIATLMISGGYPVTSRFIIIGVLRFKPMLRYYHTRYDNYCKGPNILEYIRR